MPDIQVLGVVSSQAAAEQIVGNLRLAGFPQDKISVLMVTKEAQAGLEDVADQTGEGATEVAADVAKGAAIGGGAGLLAGLATLAIPGIGPIMGTGILLGLFGGSGAFVGALSGAFASEDVSSEVINRYGMALREGQSIIGVTAPNPETAKQVEEILNAAGATNVNSYVGDRLDSAVDLTKAPGITDVSE